MRRRKEAAAAAAGPELYKESFLGTVLEVWTEYFAGS